ncbi:MAG: hypothetical protein ABIH25_00550 [Candidatus Woesearchaeota archaeon]
MNCEKTGVVELEDLSRRTTFVKLDGSFSVFIKNKIKYGVINQWNL